MDQNSNSNFGATLVSLAETLKEVEQQVSADRSAKLGDLQTVKDLRRRFDQESSRMNQAIFHDHSNAEIHREALRTVCTLVEILCRTKPS